MKIKFHLLIWSSFFILFFINCSNKTEHIKKAREFIKKWDYDRALTEIISYRKEQDAEVQYLLGYCYLKKNVFEEAANYFKNSLAIDDLFKDSIINIYDKLAKNALRINEPERALIFYQEAAKLVPEYEQASNLFLIAGLNFKKGNYPAALKAFMRAFEIDSTSEQAKKAKYNYIKTLKECDSLEQALHLAEEEYEKLKTAANMLQLNEIRFELGRKLFTEGALDSASLFFEQILAMQEPKSLLDISYFYMGEIHLKKGDQSTALKMYKKVLRLNPYEKGEIVKKAKERIKELKEKNR